MTDTDYRAQSTQDQEPVFSTIGRGPRGSGIEITDVQDDQSIGLFSFTISDDTTGEVVLKTPNLSPGVINVTQSEDHRTAFLNISRGGITQTYPIFLPTDRAARILSSNIKKELSPKIGTIVQFAYTEIGTGNETSKTVAVGDGIIFQAAAVVGEVEQESICIGSLITVSDTYVSARITSYIDVSFNPTIFWSVDDGENTDLALHMTTESVWSLTKPHPKGELTYLIDTHMLCVGDEIITDDKKLNKNVSASLAGQFVVVSETGELVPRPIVWSPIKGTLTYTELVQRMINDDPQLRDPNNIFEVTDAPVQIIVPEAPTDGREYVRANMRWVVAPGADVREAPQTGLLYARKDAGWTAFSPGAITTDAPNTGEQYTRGNGGWFPLPTMIPEAPLTGGPYVRMNGSWHELQQEGNTAGFLYAFNYGTGWENINSADWSFLTPADSGKTCVVLGGETLTPPVYRWSGDAWEDVSSEYNKPLLYGSFYPIGKFNGNSSTFQDYAVVAYFQPEDAGPPIERQGFSDFFLLNSSNTIRRTVKEFLSIQDALASVEEGDLFVVTGAVV